ncbi:MAG: transketolase, partial [Proteobacteria bacterium]|nr:transketolase [Pseudomonadota bacterium]
WRNHLKHSPLNPIWFNRDRFVLSNGHGSMLLYSLLHLSGYDLSIEDLKKFRQLHSKTPGHPEYKITPGVETTTGPLGQGLANAVGMALSEKILSAKINSENNAPIDHFTYCFLGDGCLMEGVSHEAMSLAGVMKLNKLICFYDSNGISIDGEIAEWYQDDIALRCKSYNWSVIDGVDGHNRLEIDNAIKKAKQSDKPTLIVCKTSIGYGAGSKQDSASSHGAPLGSIHLEELRRNLDWEYEPFVIPDDIYKDWDATQSGKDFEDEWHKICDKHKLESPEKSELLSRLQRNELPQDLFLELDNFILEISKTPEKIATRKASQNVLEFLSPRLDELIGGSADLSGSNNTNTSNSRSIVNDPAGNYVFYGVREFGMNAIMNGMSLHGGLIPYAGTFLVFMDYGRNAVRMSALMGLKVIYVFSHDSVALGEDGPTHQPIEHLSTLRSTPNMHTWRPASFLETAIAWKSALKRNDGPTSIILSRQNLEPIESKTLKDVESGGYFLKKDDDAEINLIGTGSEVPACIKASEILLKEDIKTNVCSIPSIEALESNLENYRSIFGANTINIVVECGHPNSWYKHTDKVIGISSFGESAPGDILLEYFGFTPEKIAEKVKKLLK